MWPFKRKRDPFLEMLLEREWRCSKCDDPHKGMFDIVAFAPASWDGPRKYEHNSQLDLGRSFLSEDFCVINGEHFLVRCVLPLPVHGLEQPFSYGCWGSLRRDNFQVYVDHFYDRSFETEEPWFSWLTTQLLPYIDEDESLLACSMHLQPNGKRPHLKVDNEDHPLAIAQCEGISPEAVLQIYRAYGHGPAIH